MQFKTSETSTLTLVKRKGIDYPASYQNTGHYKVGKPNYVDIL